MNVVRRRYPALVFVAIAMTASAVFAASERRAPPPGAFAGAPAEYTRFTPAELSRGFLALAFGSDLRIGGHSNVIRRFTHPVRVRVITGGAVPRADAYKRVLADFVRQVPALRVSVDDETQPADITVRLIDEAHFFDAMVAAFGRATARAFVKKTNPQCMTSVNSTADGAIAGVESFIIVDQGEDVFLDCAYHETLHMFGLSNHDQHNPWTTLNQKRMVGYLTVYDRMLLSILYDPRIEPGMTQEQVRAVLPAVIADLEQSR